MSKSISRVLYLTVIYLDALLPVRSSHLWEAAGPALMLPTTVLLLIEFTATDTLEPSGALLPHLSTLTCNAGGISLLHFPWGRPRRPLAVILALWSSDFPQMRPFGVHPQLSGLLAKFVK